MVVNNLMERRYFLLAGEMAHVPDLVGNERNVRTLIAQTL
jgi:hypothetical protein